ncbi:MAG: hypothetical protein ACXVAD_11245 [Syntrophales bacterium]
MGGAFNVVAGVGAGISIVVGKGEAEPGTDTDIPWTDKATDLFPKDLIGEGMNSSHFVLGVGPLRHTQSGRKPSFIASSHKAR